MTIDKEAIKEATDKMSIEVATAYFKRLAESYEICASVTDDELQKEYYSAKAEAYGLAAFELEHNVR